jgi:hypothetical protein
MPLVRGTILRGAAGGTHCRLPGKTDRAPARLSLRGRGTIDSTRTPPVLAQVRALAPVLRMVHNHIHSVWRPRRSHRASDRVARWYSSRSWRTSASATKWRVGPSVSEVARQVANVRLDQPPLPAEHLPSDVNLPWSTLTSFRSRGRAHLYLKAAPPI